MHHSSLVVSGRVIYCACAMVQGDIVTRQLNLAQALCTTTSAPHIPTFHSTPGPFLWILSTTRLRIVGIVGAKSRGRRSRVYPLRIKSEPKTRI